MPRFDTTRPTTPPELEETRLVGAGDEPPELGHALAALREERAPEQPWEKALVKARLFRASALPPTIGRYALGERLGAGGMGEVFAAHDPDLDRPVAIKVLHPGSDDDPEVSRARMLREAQTLAKLSHPHVVQVYEVGEVAGRVFIAMEFIRGRTLRQWGEQEAPGWRQVLARYLEAGRGLAAVHRAGLVHRDFKPDNVLLGEDGRVCVADFGLARRLSASSASVVTMEGGVDPGGSGPLAAATRASGVAGTPAYMAPEQLQGAAVDAGADQFGFCVALYEGLYGRRPFDGQTLGMLAAAHASGPTPPSWRAKVPRRLWRVLARGLAAAPSERFPSMDALLRALDPVRARRRRVVIAAALGVGALAVAEASREPESHERAAVEAPSASATEEGTAEEDTQQTVARHVAAARQALQRGDAALAMGVLREAPSGAATETPAWVESALQSLVEPIWTVAELRVPEGARARALVSSPDGTHLYVGTDTGRVHVWDPEAGIVLDAFDAHAGPIDGLWLGPGGDRLITSARTLHAARVWDPGTGRMLAEVRSDAEVELGRDGRTFATRNHPANTVLVWSVRTGEAVTEIELHDPPFRVSFDPMGTRLATTGDALRLWSLERPGGITVPDATERLAFDPRGTALVTSSARPSVELALRSPSTGRPLHEAVPLSSRPTALAFDSQGQTLATGHEDGTLRLWRASADEGLETIATASARHDEAIRELAFSRDGRRLATRAADDAILVWDPTTGTELARLHGTALAFAPSGEELATIEDDGAVAIWRLNEHHRRAPARDRRLLAVRRDGRSALVHDGTGRGALVLALDTGRPVVESRIDWPMHLSPEMAVYSVHGTAALGDDGARVAVGCGREIWLWDLGRGSTPAATRVELHEDALAETLEGYEPNPTVLELSADGKTLVAGTLDGYLYVIDVASARILRSFGAHPDRIERLAISPGGSRIASSSTNPSARIWRASDGALLATLEGHEGAITALAFGDEGRIVTGSADASVRVWDASSGRMRSLLRGHERAVTGVAARGEDGLVVSSAEDHTLRLWDAEDERPPIALLHDGAIESVSLVANGTRIVARGHDGTIWALDATLDRQALTRRLWQATTVRPTAEQWHALGLAVPAQRP